jgi:hypothetical protein
MLKRSLLLFLLLCRIHEINAQDTERKVAIGLGVQAYPAGVIPFLQCHLYLTNDISVSARVGYNITDRKDFSPVNDHEEGSGPGISIGLNKNFNWRKNQLFVGFMTEVWQLKINWKDASNIQTNRIGQTEVIVLQPWLNAGYLKSIGKSPIDFVVGLGFGREINIITKGDEVAQGWMGSVFAGIHYNIPSGELK